MGGEDGIAHGLQAVLGAEGGLTAGSTIVRETSSPPFQIKRFQARARLPLRTLPKFAPGNEWAEGTTPGARLTVAKGRPVSSAAIGAGKTKWVCDENVVRGCLGEQRGEDMIEAGRDGAMHERVQRDESAPFHREHVGVIADEVLARRLAGGDEAQAGGLRFRGPVGVADERDLVPAREEAAAEGEEGMQVAVRAPGGEKPAHLLHLPAVIDRRYIIQMRAAAG